MKCAGVTLASLVILLTSVPLGVTAADILSDKPYYILTELTVLFRSESRATLILNYSWYGMMATDIDSLISKLGEANYTQGFLDYVRRSVEGPFIAGDFEFYPSKMEAKVSREREGNYTRRVSLTLIAELDAKKGAPRISRDRKGIIYSTREDLCNLSKVYVREVDLLNVTVILPKDYVISLVRPTPNSIYTINSTDGMRVVASWVIRNPAVDTRGSAGYSGWFHIGVVNLTREELEMLSSLRSSIVDIRRQFVPLDEGGKGKVGELFDLFYKFSTRAPYDVGKDMSYALKLANEIPKLPVGFDAIVLMASAVIVAIEIAFYLTMRKR
ncbi:MAG: hypothetical protein QXH90_04000 [Candidatus Korarchaeum sp.]